MRIITGSYEHNLLCVQLTLTPQNEVFTPIFHFTPHLQSIRSLAFNNKRTLVSGSNDELIRLYDLKTRREVGTLMNHQGQILVLEFFKSKWLLTGASDNKINIFRVKDWELLAELKGHTAPVLDLSIHESGKIAISVGVDHKLILWNLMTARKASIRKLKNAPIQCEFVPNTKADYMVAFDRQVVHYGPDGKSLNTIEVKSKIHRMKFYRQQLFVSMDNGEILVILNGEIVDTLVGHKARVKDFSFLDNYMASVSSDGNIVVWDLEKRETIAVYNAGDRLNCVQLVPDEVEDMKRKRVEVEVESEEEEEEEVKVEVKKEAKKKKSRVKVTRTD